MEKPKLFAIGPVYVNEKVRNEMSRQMFSHRSNTYRELHSSLVQKLKKLMKTNNEILIFTSSSSGIMEACARNLVKGDEKVLCISCGAFGERFGKIFELNGKNVKILSNEWGKANLPDEIDNALSEDTYALVTLIHNETSTGLMNPLKEISDVVKKHNVLFAVDTVSSMGGANVNVDDYGIDICFFGSQKCLATPPGIAIGSVSNRALSKSKEVKNKGFYLNFEILKKSNDKNETPVTPPIPQMFAMSMSIDLIFEEGHENVVERHKNIAKFVRDRIKDIGFEIFPDENFASQTLTCADFENFKKAYPKFDVNVMKEEMKKRGFILANGYGKIKDKTFRIGNMGNVMKDDVKEMLDNLEEVVNMFKPKFDT
ncbi:MAG: alanine--glyoxylate aminotransferase family protein [Candidatus Altiarchaeum hamiconexum]|uniref:Alanine--glyoxylate aminotransferase family protein n=1 Tax=Candidatus Altarchaeum hamiconexum TaxID=1803513 RepID=A0A8J7YVM4_9ARCH|nr:alanine--glyoxylate aminotransferase family protein [Candidatus Altarchaeum hamiconexum]NCS90851.1 alanine--glyoxylate aminotransferase family protein [Candidatus Altarchaeum hamiconexum]OIQ06049.1 MAG: hypothetical protein AUK59_01395 [Candidatus Altarchaeum sp. CG2_30_32_3053]